MRISVKLLAISELVLLVAVLVLIVPILTTMHDQVVDDMKNELLAIAGTAALQIDGDLHRQIRERDDAQSEAFRTLRRTLTADRDADCDEVVARLRREMIEHCAEPSQTDDVAIVCVDRL